MKRVEILINDTLYNQYLQRNIEGESEPKSCLYGFRHHIDVARIAYILVLEHNDLNYFIQEHGLTSRLAAKEVIYAAGLLHDIGKWQEYKLGTDHASFGAKLAREILPRAFFNPSEVELIARAIYEHRNISSNMTFLGERLHRAENLSRICVNCEYDTECPKRSQETAISNLEY
jgi:uncharacterized protein